MDVKLIIIVTVVGVTAAVHRSYKDLKLINKAYSCIMNTIPDKDWYSADVFRYDYMVNISYQWDPLNHHDYLQWSRDEGPEAWRAGCHFSDTIRRCLQPIMEQKIDLNKYFLNSHAIVVVKSLFYLALCEYESVLADNAVCIHNRMLSDDVLSCSGVLAWRMGDYTMYLNRQLYTGREIQDIVNKEIPPSVKHLVAGSAANINTAIYHCIYIRGQWKKACGESVDQTINKLVNKFTSIVKQYINFNGDSDMIIPLMCDRCKKKGSNLKSFKYFNNLKFSLLWNLLFDNQNPGIFKECQLVDYPLNHCHTQHIWRRDLFNMFCHNVTFKIAPQLEPYLPLCDFAEWIQSAKRICNMGYDRFMEIASHIEHCTDGKDELFPCYKGLHIDMRMSWGLLTAGRFWRLDHTVYNIGVTYSAIYTRIKQCSMLVYDHLSRTCKHGVPVARLIQDIRTVLSISRSDINSLGVVWLKAHKILRKKWKQRVTEC